MGCEPLGGTDWGDIDIPEVMNAVREAWDCGINTFDTSDIYGIGASEENLGKALGPHRHEAVIVTKFGLIPHVPPGGGRATVTKDASPNAVLNSLENSLRRLDIECIPLYLLHYPDPNTPISETIGVLQKCQEQGKIRNFGVSNFNLDQLAQMCDVCPPSVLQVQYSLIDRKVEDALLPGALAAGVSGMVYGSLAQGLLTGKYSPSAEFGNNDRRHRLPHFTPEAFDELAGLLAELERVSQETGLSQSQVAIQWVLRNPAVTMAIVGAKTPSQARHNADTLRDELPVEAVARLTEAARSSRIKT
jgi:aryl-alcohol dehydrogenase-like predicted oxidoreductase